MEGVTFNQFSVHDGAGFELFGVELVDSVNGEGGRREVVVVVEGAVEVAFIVLFYFPCELGLVSPVYAPGENRADEIFLEAHRNHVFLVGLYFNVVQRVVRIPLHPCMQHRHLPLVFQQKGGYHRAL